MSVCQTAINRRKAAKQLHMGFNKNRGGKIRGRIERVYVDTGPKKIAKMGHRK